MAMCEVCGKKVAFGNKVSHSNKKSRRTWKPNVKKIKVLLQNGQRKRIYVCTSCIKAGKVARA
ncbi:ribosomal protein L28 [Caldicellulosiruptor kronotskyensis 2002]|uniref:Large ribosomal subunit protein bL28 n=1 Tax=Caldicellulosiruptor kronotskyensis (strain DSM 18902 / VKM B-2412 / 2002) TaxID=632348 RepID=E4SE52_CALK2|nr:50S ribosomal protein L28 [Caldicellulosiruptor kronotskyensis]ADQ45339.1 ribosomal protein L28 [Caldicellulosiruptor kronotskyensis 2002]